MHMKAAPFHYRTYVRTISFKIGAPRITPKTSWILDIVAYCHSFVRENQEGTPPACLIDCCVCCCRSSQHCTVFATHHHSIMHIHFRHCGCIVVVVVVVVAVMCRWWVQHCHHHSHASSVQALPIGLIIARHAVITIIIVLCHWHAQLPIGLIIAHPRPLSCCCHCHHHHALLVRLSEYCLMILSPSSVTSMSGI